LSFAQLTGELWALPLTRSVSSGAFIMEAFRASALDFPRAAVVACFDVRSLDSQSLEDRPISYRLPRVLAATARPASLHQEIAGRIPDCQRTDQES
jgi:hypothetical protein